MGYLNLIEETLNEILKNEAEANVYYELIKTVLQKKHVITKDGSIYKNREGCLKYFCCVLKQFSSEDLPEIDFGTSFNFDSLPKEAQENILTFVGKFIFAPVKSPRSEFQSLFSSMFFLENPKEREIGPDEVIPEYFRGMPFLIEWDKFSDGASPFEKVGTSAREFLDYLIGNI